jgi:urease accessory protein
VAEQQIRLRLAPDATLEWVPDHTIPFADSAFRQRVDVQVAAGARLILVDAFAAGRVARGETWRFSLLESGITIRDERGLLLHDRLVLGGHQRWAGLGLAEHRAYFATVVVIGPEEGAALVRAVTADPVPGADVALGAGALGRGGIVVRVLAASAPALVEALDHVWGLARRAVLGLAPLTLRKT